MKSIARARISCIASRLIVTMLCAWLIICSVAVISDEKADFYVSPFGRDHWSGRLPAPNSLLTDGPFASINKARDIIRKYGAGKAHRSRSWMVYLRGGIYTPNEVVMFTPADSGRKGQPVVYKAYPGEVPVLSGGRPIGKWQKLEKALPDMSAEAIGKLWVADIPKAWLFHSMFVDDVKQPRAATPNTEDWRKWPYIRGAGERAPGGQPLQFKGGELDHVPGNGDVEMCFLPHWRYMNEMFVLRDVDPEKRTAKRHSKNITYPGRRGDPYRIENALVALDKPGEWCVDSTLGRVYYWPLNGSMDGVKVVAPKLNNLIRFQGKEESGPWVHHITLSGITFMYTDRLPEDKWPDSWLKRNFENPDATLFMQGVDSCTVEHCRFLHMGTYAVALDHYAQRNRITGNEIGYTGSGGIQLYGYGSGTTDVNKFNEISLNHIHHSGLVYWHAGGITLSGSNSNKIELNYMHDLPYSAIMISGQKTTCWNRRNKCESDAYGNIGAMFNVRWDELPDGSYDRWLANDGTFDEYSIKRYLNNGTNYMEHNIVERFMQRLNDGGALYSFYVAGGNTWRKNAVFSDTDMHLLNPIYMDGGTDGSIIEGNMICAPGKLWDNGGAGTNKWVASNTKAPSYQLESDWTNNRFNGEEIPAFPFMLEVPNKGLTPEYRLLVKEIFEEVEEKGGWLNASKPVGLEM